jgi:hypothetical protein
VLIDMAETALGGLKVIELSRFLPGGLATQMLGDLGAEMLSELGYSNEEMASLRSEGPV